MDRLFGIGIFKKYLYEKKVGKIGLFFEWIYLYVFFDLLLVNGGWSNWFSYFYCFVLCGGGN